MSPDGSEPRFDQSDLHARLDERSAAELDELPFGVIRMTRDARVVVYNRAESRLSGLSPDEVVGQSFFVQVAPCTNNELIAERYAAEDPLDATVEYMFTFRMAPTTVRLRLLKHPDSRYQYLVVRRT
jgi:photoactive yellow protein